MEVQEAITGYAPSAAQEDILTRYPPPYVLTADMLFALAFCPAAWLQVVFPHEPFIVLFGKIPLALWFSRICEIAYNDGQALLGGPDTMLYDELNVMALRRPHALRSFFVPGIYATSALSLQIGRRYGMPKDPATMQLSVTERRIESMAEVEGIKSWVQGTRWGSGKFAGTLLSGVLPRIVWKAHFPGGRAITARILSAPRLQGVHIPEGQLALPAPWLPATLPLFRFGCYAPGLRFYLPPPETQEEERQQK